MAFVLLTERWCSPNFKAKSKDHFKSHCSCTWTHTYEDKRYFYLRKLILFHLRKKAISYKTYSEDVRAQIAYTKTGYKKTTLACDNLSCTIMWLIFFFFNVNLITKAWTFRRLYQLVSPLMSHSILWINTPQRILKRWLKKKQCFLKASIKLFQLFPYHSLQCHEGKPCFIWHFPWQQSAKQVPTLLLCSSFSCVSTAFQALGHKPVHIKNSLVWLKGQKSVG